MTEAPGDWTYEHMRDELATLAIRHSEFMVGFLLGVINSASDLGADHNERLSVATLCIARQVDELIDLAIERAVEQIPAAGSDRRLVRSVATNLVMQQIVARLTELD